MLNNKIVPGKILLHVCCAPCCCAILEKLLEEGFQPTLFFYNPNIYPKSEYEIRKQSVISFARKRDVPFIDAEYDNNQWMERVRGLENEPERGKRCSVCFDIRLDKAARYAVSEGFSVFATTNGLSRWKDLDQINHSGLFAAKRYPGLTFWDRDWRKGNLQEKAQKTTKEEGFYRQQYCGCRFSLENLNRICEKSGYSRLSSGQ